MFEICGTFGTLITPDIELNEAKLLKIKKLPLEHIFSISMCVAVNIGKRNKPIEKSFQTAENVFPQKEAVHLF